MSQNWNPGPPGQPPGGGAPPGGGGFGGPPPGGGGFGGPPGGPPPGGYGGPPAGGYGGPMPYGVQPPQQPFGMQPQYATPVTGNLFLGILAGFFGGCIGLGLVYAIAKGPETKKGAAIGFVGQIVVGGLLRAMR